MTDMPAITMLVGSGITDVEKVPVFCAVKLAMELLEIERPGGLTRPENERLKPPGTAVPPNNATTGAKVEARMTLLVGADAFKTGVLPAGEPLSVPPLNVAVRRTTPAVGPPVPVNEIVPV